MRQLMKQQAGQMKAGESKEESSEKEPGDKVGKTFNYESITPDLNELKNLNISGSIFSASSDVRTLSNAIRKTRSVMKRMDKLSISQQAAQNVEPKVSALKNILTPAVTNKLGTGKQQSLLGSVSAASLTGAEPIGFMIILEILGRSLPPSPPYWKHLS